MNNTMVKDFLTNWEVPDISKEEAFRRIAVADEHFSVTKRE